MARRPRLAVPALPHHVIQRGNNRQPIFFTDADYPGLPGQGEGPLRLRG
ncbi:MAG: hypothetical protein ABIO65_04250 [Nitrospiria bacterium]